MIGQLPLGRSAVSPKEELRMASLACSCADHILEHYFRVPIAKAMRLDSPEAFDLAVARLAAALREHAEAPEAEALRAALDILDVDWLNTTADQRQELVSRAVRAAKRIVLPIADRMAPTLSETAQDVTEAARLHAREAGLHIGKDFTALDARIMAFMTRSHTLFVRDAYGQRAETFGEEARKLVAHGMAQGYGRDDIAEDLARAAEKALLQRSRPYWELVAGAFVGRGRSYAQVSSYAEARISRYRIEAVLDERTSNICRFLHGRIFAVDDAVQSFRRAERLTTPEAIKGHSPWPREDGAGLYILRDGRRTTLAHVERSGMGTWDDLGAFDSPHTSSDLSKLGVGLPPFHGLCRTTVLPVVP